MKKLIADCGATKTLWCILQGNSTREVCTPGFNLAHTPRETLESILTDAAEQIGPGVEEVHFFAAGLLGRVPVDLGRWFPGAAIEYASDMLGAARAVCGHEKGVALILGTGANTCSYDGKDMGWKVNSGGFIVGDEGSASVLGKLFVADYIKDCVPETMARDFASRFQAAYPSLVKNIYRSEAPARYLGSLAPFILSWYEREEYARLLVDNNFRGLFQRTLCRYDPELPIGVVGGFGYASQDILKRLSSEYNVSFSKFLKTPMEGLVQYYAI